MSFSFFSLLALRNGNTFAGVVGEHFHLHSVAENIADEAEVMNGYLSRQRSAVFQAFAVKCQIVDKLLDMSAGDLVKSEVSDAGYTLTVSCFIRS